MPLVRGHCLAQTGSGRFSCFCVVSWLVIFLYQGQSLVSHAQANPQQPDTRPISLQAVRSA